VITIAIDAAAISKITDEFLGATGKKVEVARLRAMRNTAKWLGGEILKQVARKERMPVRALKKRVFVRPIKPGDGEASVWVGTEPVDVTTIGNPVQNKKGVNVGRFASYRGAFLARIYTGKEKVWIRKSSPFFEPSRYPTRYRAGDRGAHSDPTLMGRFPVVKAAVPIDGIAQDVAEKLELETYARFSNEFRHELNFELVVKGGK